MSSPAPVDDNETLVPSVADVLVSYACLPVLAAIRCSEETSVYVRALVDHLRPGVDVDVIDALNKVSRQFKDCLHQFSPHAKTHVVPTVNRSLVFPYKR